MSDIASVCVLHVSSMDGANRLNVKQSEEFWKNTSISYLISMFVEREMPRYSLYEAF